MPDSGSAGADLLDAAVELYDRTHGPLSLAERANAQRWLALRSFNQREINGQV